MAGCPKLTCIFLFTCSGVVLGFNIDTWIPVIKEGPKDSYFGYSVAQHQVLNQINPFKLGTDIIGNYLIIGAPKLDLDSSNENYTGGVYKCDATSPRLDDCELLLTSEYSSNAQEDKGRNDQWLGVTVRSGGTGKGLVACAHRYKVTDNNYGLGSCYQMPQDMQYDQNMGQGNMFSPCKGHSIRKEHEEYAFCQAGTSAYVTENEELIMGAPGAINWRGMLAATDISAKLGVKRLYRSPTTEADPVAPPVPPISYLGYSVVGGKFDNSNRTYYVAAAPRSYDTGQVIFFTRMNSGSVLRYEEVQKLKGELPFTGFGQDLIALDFNGDSYLDLVVGCPFYYSKEKDSIRLGGAIYMYTGNGDMITNFTKPQVIPGRSLSQDECDQLDCLHARFGFSLAKAGDLNNDGFEDFAVGAPYEGNGAVYIFHGSANGVLKSFSQRIYAEDLKSALDWTSFGYSLSGGLDLDNNSYPDLLVGSYEMNKVALLRTRPIIHLHPEVTVTPKKLNMSSESEKKCESNGRRVFCVDLKLCLRYTAEPAERFNGPVDIIYTISAEPERISPRMEFKTGILSTNKVESRFRLLPQEQTGPANDPNPRFSCVVQTAYLKEQITDVLSTLEFGISYKLPEKPIPTFDPSARSLPDINEYPILDAGLTMTETMMITEVEFVKKCGDNQICESNLQMNVGVDLTYNKDNIAVLELGTSDRLRVEVMIRNLGEIAYQTAFYLKKPPSLTWKDSEPKNIGCDPVNDTLVECKEIGSKELGKPLKAGAVSEFKLVFQPNSDLISTVRTMELTAWVNTTSEEKTPLLDHKVIPIIVYVNADLQVTGKTEPDSAILYSGAVRGESAITEEHMIGPSVNHTYTVFNNGPGDIQSSDIIIYWPYELASRYPHGKHLLYLMSPPEVLDGGDATCFEQSDIVNVAGIKPDTENPEYTVVRRRRREVGNDDTVAEEEDTDDGASDGPVIGEAKENKQISLLDCDTGTAKCHEIRCKIGFLKDNGNVKIRINARLWESTLLEDFRNVDQVNIRSKARIHIRPELNVVQRKTNNDEYYATTIAIPSIPVSAEKPLQWWIIALAVLGGLILLILLALCLWKIGFFKRQRFDNVTTYNVKVQKKKDIHNPTYDTKVETQKDYDESDYFLKN